MGLGIWCLRVTRVGGIMSIEGMQVKRNRVRRPMNKKESIYRI